MTKRQWGFVEPRTSDAVSEEAGVCTNVQEVQPDERRQELDRRAALVVKATEGLEMRERIYVARQLLLVLVKLSAGEWDAAFGQWASASGRRVA